MSSGGQNAGLDFVIPAKRSASRDRGAPDTAPFAPPGLSDPGHACRHSGMTQERFMDSYLPLKVIPGRVPGTHEHFAGDCVHGLPGHARQ